MFKVDAAACCCLLLLAAVAGPTQRGNGICNAKKKSFEELYVLANGEDSSLSMIILHDEVNRLSSFFKNFMYSMKQAPSLML